MAYEDESEELVELDDSPEEMDEEELAAPVDEHDVMY